MNSAGRPRTLRGESAELRPPSSRLHHAVNPSPLPYQLLLPGLLWPPIPFCPHPGEETDAAKTLNFLPSDVRRTAYIGGSVAHLPWIQTARPGCLCCLRRAVIFDEHRDHHRCHEPGSARRSNGPPAVGRMTSSSPTTPPSGRAVREVAHRLRENNVTVWFDKESLAPGDAWQARAVRALDGLPDLCRLRPAATISPVGRALEMEVAIDRAHTDRDFRVFAVLLPGIGLFDPSTLPRFLAMKQWVDLREGPESSGAVQDLVNAIRGVPPPRPPLFKGEDECPYRGLDVFEEKHSRYFFGREAYVQRLLKILRRDRFVAVVGQSGVGKSSLMRAGLLPRLRGGRPAR